VPRRSGVRQAAAHRLAARRYELLHSSAVSVPKALFPCLAGSECQAAGRFDAAPDRRRGKGPALDEEVVDSNSATLTVKYQVRGLICLADRAPEWFPRSQRHGTEAPVRGLVDGTRVACEEFWEKGGCHNAADFPPKRNPKGRRQRTDMESLNLGVRPGRLVPVQRGSWLQDVILVCTRRCLRPRRSSLAAVAIRLVPLRVARDDGRKVHPSCEHNARGVSPQCPRPAF
jgi:hypothetical protein